MSATVDQVERPLVTPDEVMRLRPPTKSGHGAAERIAAPGDMLIFVSGHYPIYSTQILYFTDPVLAKRADLPPHRISSPSKTAVSSRSAGQIEHAMRSALPSRDNRPPPVPPAPATARSPMEEAFWKGGEQAATDLPISPVSAGFTGQLDLDLHESEI